jgi:hypothetical protein
MSFVANDTVSGALMHRTILPALQDAFPVDVRGVPPTESTPHRAILTTPPYGQVVAGTAGSGMPDG